MPLENVLAELRAKADHARTPGMAGVGIDVSRALGVSVPDIRAIAKRVGTDHDLARALWRTGIHEARILATLVADPEALGDEDMEAWVAGLSSSDVCDFAADLFAATPTARRKIRAWARPPEGFVKRCAFSMIARRAVSAKTAPDREFLGGSDGRTERGQEGRLVVAQADREAEPNAPHRRPRRGRADPRIGFCSTLDRAGRPPGARERQGSLSAPGLTRLKLRSASPTRRPRPVPPAQQPRSRAPARVPRRSASGATGATSAGTS